MIKGMPLCGKSGLSHVTFIQKQPRHSIGINYCTEYFVIRSILSEIRKGIIIY